MGEGRWKAEAERTVERWRALLVPSFRASLDADSGWSAVQTALVYWIESGMAKVAQEAARERDLLWCRVLLDSIGPKGAESVIAAFNARRPDPALPPAAPVSPELCPICYMAHETATPTHEHTRACYDDPQTRACLHGWLPEPAAPASPGAGEAALRLAEACLNYPWPYLDYRATSPEENAVIEALEAYHAALRRLDK